MESDEQKSLHVYGLVVAVGLLSSGGITSASAQSNAHEQAQIWIRVQMMALFSAALRCHRQQWALLRRNRTLVIVLWLAASLTGIAVAFSRTADSDAANLAFDQAKVSPIMIHTWGSPSVVAPLRSAILKLVAPEVRPACPSQFMVLAAGAGFTPTPFDFTETGDSSLSIWSLPVLRDNEV